MFPACFARAWSRSSTVAPGPCHAFSRSWLPTDASTTTNSPASSTSGWAWSSLLPSMQLTQFWPSWLRLACRRALSDQSRPAKQVRRPACGSFRERRAHRPPARPLRPNRDVHSQVGEDLELVHRLQTDGVPAGRAAPRADAFLAALPDDIDAIGGLTMGADPVAFGVAGVAAARGRVLRSC